MNRMTVLKQQVIIKQPIKLNNFFENSQVALSHQHLGHFYRQGMPCVITSDAINGLTFEDGYGYFHLQIMHRGKTLQCSEYRRHKPRTHTSIILKPVHTNSPRLFRFLMLEGYYFLTSIEAYSRKIWICFLLHKSQCFEKFKFLLTYT